MANLMETLYDIVFEPSKAMRDIAEGRKLKQAFIAFFIGTLLPMWALYSGLKTVNMHGFTTMVLSMHVFGGLVMWFFAAAVFSLVAELFGGRGSAAGLFAAMGFVHIPKLFALPLFALSVLLPASFRPFWLAAGVILIVCWILYLEVAAIKGAYNVSGSKAVLVMVFPVAAMLLLCLVATVFLGAAALSAMPMRWL